MKISEVVEKLELKAVVDSNLEKEATGGYVGDLLSNVMARAKSGDIWITIQGHQNVIAVALLADVSAVIIAEDFDVEEKAVERARDEGINLLRTSQPAYEIAGRLYELGLK